MINGSNKKKKSQRVILSPSQQYVHGNTLHIENILVEVETLFHSLNAMNLSLAYG